LVQPACLCIFDIFSMIDRLSPNYSDLPGLRPANRMYVAGATAPSHVDVSVLTPYFNTEDFFSETFACIRAQSLQNWEWIIVDDGSTDTASVARLRALAATDSRIQVVHQANAGPSAARNRAFKNAKGRYVCLLDSDDMVEPTYLEKAVWFLDSNPEFAFCNTYSVVFGDQQYLWANGFERGAAHLHANSGPPISVIRHSAYAECGGFDESIRFGHEDWDFWLSMAAVGHWGYTIAEYLQWYRKRGNGRFEQIMRADGVNSQFEQAMHLKYASLRKNFPAPLRTVYLPFESLNMQAAAENPLKAASLGHRFLFLVPWMVTGGADRVNLDLLEGLVSQGHQVTVCATLPADHSWEHEFAKFTTDVFVLPNILAANDYPRFLNYLIQSRGIDTVLITGSAVGYQFLPSMRAAAPQVAYIDMCHVEEPHWLNGGHPRFAVGYQDQLDLNITTTQHLADWMCDRGAERARIEVMLTGIRTSKAAIERKTRAEVRAELGIAAQKPVIVFAGRLCAQKRPALLAQILGVAKESGLDYEAVIVGDGELRQEFEALLSKYHVADRVQMVGSLSHDRWLDVLGASDILLMPSQYEGISIALLEAIASGVVPLVARVGGQAEIVSSDAGILVPHGPDELQEYVAALQRLIGTPHQHALMAARCKELASSRLSWSAMIQHFLQIVDHAHALRLNQPRQTLAAGFAREMATLALESKRLSDAVEWLWHRGTNEPLAQMAANAGEVQAITRFAVALSRTWLVRRLIRNGVVRKLAKWFLAKGSSPTSA
jgi:glycosyltransferase involved in cell wall biosynthesis